MCGEKPWWYLSPCLIGGSPPRVRGKVTAAIAELKTAGITPACAGKSLSFCCCSLGSKDHPRVCGEKRRSSEACRFWIGSPPRVRGKVSPGAVHNLFTRITPACAGKRRRGKAKLCQIRDHPRVCGEKVTREMLRADESGSPPRVRGKDVKEIYRTAGAGITPACAGKRQHNSS